MIKLRAEGRSIHTNCVTIITHCRYIIGYEDVIPCLDTDTVTFGDARKMPYVDCCFDVVILSAMLKHVLDYQNIVSQARRVLSPGGHMIVLDPTPLGIRLGIAMGHFDSQSIRNSWTLKQLARALQPLGLDNVRGRKYALSPLEFPGHELLERIFSKVGFTFSFLQQIAVFRKL